MYNRHHCQMARNLGSAENKIPYDYMCLADVIQKNDDLTKGYLVLGGDGGQRMIFS